MALLYMVFGWDHPKYFLLSALFIGLAHLTRQDGILLFVTLVIVILISTLSFKKRIAFISLASGLYILILAPLLISNYKIFGLPLPPGPSKSMFITHYEDQYSYAKELNFENYLSWGLGNIVRSKISGMEGNGKVVYDKVLGTFIKVFALVGALMLFTVPKKREEFKKYFPAILFFSLLYIFYSIIVPVSSGTAGFTRSSVSLIPIFVILAVDTMVHLIPSKIVVSILLLFITISSLNQSLSFIRSELAENSRIGQELEKLNQVIINQISKDEQAEMVIMTRNPWEVYHTTRHKAVQIPNDDLDTIYLVAQRFEANYLLLPAPRAALEDLYNGTVPDSRFEVIADVPDSKFVLFKIKLEK